MLPSALHLLECTYLRFITFGDDFVQILVLRLYHLISGVSVERENHGPPSRWHVMVFIDHITFPLLFKVLGR